MKKLFIYASMACAIVLSGCSSMDDMGSQAPNTTLSADVETSAETRTYLGNYDGATQNYSVLWESADHIGVYDAGTWKDFTITNGIGATRATFSGNLSAVPSTYKAFYPYSIVSGSSDAATITLPATQTYRNEGTDHDASQHVIGQNMWPAYSEYSSQPLPFKNLCGAIRFNVKCATGLAGGTITGAKLTVTGTAKGLCGQYTVSDYSATTGPALTAVSGKTANTVSLTVASGPALNASTASSIYFVLPPQTYLTDGVATQNLNLEVTVTQADGTSATYSRSLSKGAGYNLVVDRSQITQMNMTLYKNGLTYDNAFLYWGNEDTSSSTSGYVAGTDDKTDVNGVDFKFNLNTFKTYGGTYYIRIPAGMYWVGDASMIKAGTSGTGCVIGLTGPAKLDFNVYISPDMYTYSKDCNLYIFDGATYTAAQALTQDKANAAYTAKVVWKGRIGYEAQDVTDVTYTSAVSEIQNSGETFCTAVPSKFTLTENTSILQILNSTDPLKDMVNSRYSVWEVLNGTQKNKVFIEQTSLAFVASPIRYDETNKRYNYTNGNMILVQGIGTKSTGFQVTGGDWMANSTKYYVPNPSTGEVTTYADVSNEGDAYVQAESHAVAAGYTTKISPCEMVYPLHSFREATDKEAKRLVDASTMPGDYINPYVKFTQGSNTYNITMYSFYNSQPGYPGYYGGTGTNNAYMAYCMSTGYYKWMYLKINETTMMGWFSSIWSNPTYSTYDTPTNRAVTGNGYRVWGYNNNDCAMLRICVRR